MSEPKKTPVEPQSLTDEIPNWKLSTNPIARHERATDLITNDVISPLVKGQLLVEQFTDFCSLLEPFYPYSVGHPSPTMPICYKHEFSDSDTNQVIVFSALACLAIPTLLLYQQRMTDDQLKEKLLILERAGYYVIPGFLTLQ